MLEIRPNNNFIEFQLEVENTTLDKVTPRLVVEINNTINIIPLTVNENGIVKGDILLKEEWDNQEGKIKLEIINESNYFIPFESKVRFFDIKTSKTDLIKEVKIKSKPTIKFLKSQSSQTLKISDELISESKELLNQKESITPPLSPNLTNDIKNFFKSQQ